MADNTIPIQNLYYLLCYAWGRLEQRDFVDVAKLPSTELVDLFAIILVKGIEHLARRGFERSYTLQSEELRSIRGRIDVLSTGRRLLLEHGRAACIFDELTTDTLPNQIVKATLKTLATDPSIDPDNRSAVLNVARQFQGVQDITVTTKSFRCIQLNGNNRFYRFLLNVCELVHGAWLATQEQGSYRFRDFVRDEKRMALVFQYFVFHFLRIERPDLNVFGETIYWNAESNDDEHLLLLPQMHTDISILNGSRKIIVDTKYYAETFSTYHDTKKIHSEHLYQLLSYLINCRRGDETIEGILLYPTVDKPVELRYVILGIAVRIQTLNLAQPWKTIHDSLMQLPN